MYPAYPFSAQHQEHLHRIFVICILSPNVLNILVSKFDLRPITTPENDLQAILKRYKISQD